MTFITITVDRDVAERALSDYGNERDWQKMRPDEMFSVVVNAADKAIADVVPRSMYEDAVQDLEAAKRRAYEIGCAEAIDKAVVAERDRLRAARDRAVQDLKAVQGLYDFHADPSEPGSMANELGRLRADLEAATKRADDNGEGFQRVEAQLRSVTAEWRDLVAERDAAVARAKEAESANDFMRERHQVDDSRIVIAESEKSKAEAALVEAERDRDNAVMDIQECQDALESAQARLVEARGHIKKLLAVIDSYEPQWSKDAAALRFLEGDQATESEDT